MLLSPGSLRPLYGHVLASALALAACSSSVAEAPVAEAPAVDAGTSGTDAAPSRSVACAAQDEALAELVASTRKSPVAALAVTNEACGTSVYVSAQDEVPSKDALYRVGSVTKTYVAAAILIVEGEGKLSLSDPVSKYVAGFPVLEKVTVKQLLDHTSGLPNFTADPDFARLKKQKRTPREVVEKALTRPVSFAPGEGFAYSNTNYTLLGMVLEQATGEKVSAVIRARVLVPLALERTFLDGEEALPEPLVRGNDTRGRDQTNAEDPSNPWTAGAVVASVGDVARFHRALFGGTFLSPPANQKLTLGPVPTGDGRTSYGLGVFILDPTRTGFGPALSHGGDIEGYHTASTHYADHRTAITSVVNQDGVDPSAVLLRAARVLFTP